MKKLVLIATAVVFATVIGFGAVAGDKKPPEGPTAVTNYGSKKVVNFDHSKHTDVDCAKCHHNEGKNEGKGEYKKCGDCHKLEAEGDALKIKDAMHKKELGVCWECHSKKGSEQKRKCGDCHKD
jgi:hypothetical protein